MAVSRREFLKASVATSVAAGSLSWFGASEVFGADTVVIPSASHWGPFKAVVKKGVLVGVQPLPGIDAMPTKMLTEGLISRVYHKSRVMYPMVRKSYLANPMGDTKPHLRGKEPFVRVTWDEILALTANAILTTAEQHGNEALFSSSYGGWSHAGLLRPQVLQGRLFGLIGGHSVTTGDYSGGASQTIQLVRHIDGKHQRITKTELFNLQIGADIFNLLGQEHRLLFGGIQGVAKEGGKLADRLRGGGGVEPEEAHNRVQRVEEKMRINLHPERFLLGQRQLPPQVEILRLQRIERRPG